MALLVPKSFSEMGPIEPAFLTRDGEPWCSYGLGPTSRAIGGPHSITVGNSGRSWGMFPSQWIGQSDHSLQCSASTQHLESVTPAYASVGTNAVYAKPILPAIVPQAPVVQAPFPNLNPGIPPSISNPNLFSNYPNYQPIANNWQNTRLRTTC